jgi:hypothetical protein
MKIVITESQLNLIKESEVTDGYDLSKIKKAIKLMSSLSTTFGEYIPLNFKLYGYNIRKNERQTIMDLYIDIDTESGKVYSPPSSIMYDISQQLLEMFHMLKIRNEKRMYPLYNFYFNKRSLESITII